MINDWLRALFRQIAASGGPGAQASERQQRAALLQGVPTRRNVMRAWSTQMRRVEVRWLSNA